VKIKDLQPGMLLRPMDGYTWVVVPWKGADGTIVGQYLKVVSDRYKPSPEELTKKDDVLYLGDSSSLPTPGRQVVLAWGKKMTIDSSGWRFISSIY
jgi:hypothetical protein